RHYPEDHGFCFLFFGRLMQYKGVDLLLEAFARLRTERGQDRLIIAGDGPWQRKSMPEGVTLIQRWIADDEIESLFRNADAVVLPYLEASQSGAVPLATAYMLPAIA